MKFWKSRKQTARLEETGLEVLRILSGSTSPQNVSQLSKATGQKGGYVVNALLWNHRYGNIESRQRVSRFKVAADEASFTITETGRRVLRQNQHQRNTAHN